MGAAACDASIAHPDSLYLGLDYFGLEQFPNRPYGIATLAVGYADDEGVEFIFGIPGGARGLALQVRR